jgi:nitrogen regulatory protein P-II 1
MKALKRIEAIIKPFALDEIKDAIAHAGAAGMTLCEVSELDELPPKRAFKGAAYTVGFAPQLKLEIIASEDRVNDIVTAIIDVLTSTLRGDGRIIVTDVLEIVRIRTGDWGIAAL